MAWGGERKVSLRRGLQREIGTDALTHFSPSPRHKPGVQKGVPIGCGGTARWQLDGGACTREF